MAGTSGRDARGRPAWRGRATDRAPSRLPPPPDGSPPLPELPYAVLEHQSFPELRSVSPTPPARPRGPCRAVGSWASRAGLSGGRVQHLDSGSGAPPAPRGVFRRPAQGGWGRGEQPRVLQKRDQAWREPSAAKGTPFRKLKYFFRAYTRPPPDRSTRRGCPQRNQHLLGVKGPLSAQRVDAPVSSALHSPQSSLDPSAESCLRGSNPRLAATSQVVGGSGRAWQCAGVGVGGGEGLNGAATPRVKLQGERGAGGVRGEAPGREAGRPSQLASAPSIPHWSG